MKVSALLLGAALFVAGCATEPKVPIPRFYEYWSRGPKGVGRFGIDTSFYEELFARRGPQQKFYSESERDFYDAAHGDLAALHRFFHSPGRDEKGAPGEAWYADMVILALYYGDHRLYEALRPEPSSVKESVGVDIEQEMLDDRDSFTETRTLYKFRY